MTILFFLVLSISSALEKYKKLSDEETQEELTLKETLNKSNIETDSIKKIVEIELQNIPIPENKKNKITNNEGFKAKDTINSNALNLNSVSLFGTSINSFLEYQKKYPNSSTDKALDSLKVSKNFKNRFMYQKAKLINEITSNNESKEKFLNESLSYGSVSLFVFLPLFTLFLKLFYIRRKYTYVDHLIFVFHTQTVLFMILTLFYLLSFFTSIKSVWIFILLFLMYLFLAMKKFYGQGFFKTFIKFTLLNIVYFFMSIFGAILVTLITFTIY